MADITLTARTPLDGVIFETNGSAVRERTNVALVSVAIPQHGLDAAVARLKEALALAAPGPLMASSEGANHVLQMTPDQWMLVLEHSKEAEALSSFAGVAYTTLQTDAWVVIEVSGPRARAALERLCPLDLHDQAFSVNQFGRTVMEHMSAVILRTGPDTWWLMSASSSAGSFWHAIETSVKNVS